MRNHTLTIDFDRDRDIAEDREILVEKCLEILLKKWYILENVEVLTFRAVYCEVYEY